MSKNNNDVDDNIIDIKDFKGKEVYHYKMLETFFNNCDTEQLKRMIKIINGEHEISLRFLDWFVTRYCFLYKITMDVENSYNVQKNFNINISYKAQLKSFKKKYFDPFRRKKKFYFADNKDEHVILTTLGQLNFFRWAISYDIIDYTQKNLKQIMSKINHVNSYFKKNILIDNSSYDNLSTDKSDNKSEKSMDSDIIKEIYSTKINKKEYKAPQVSRNILLEL